MKKVLLGLFVLFFGFSVGLLSNKEEITKRYYQWRFQSKIEQLYENEGLQAVIKKCGYYYEIHDNWRYACQVVPAMQLDLENNNIFYVPKFYIYIEPVSNNLKSGTISFAPPFDN